MLGRNQVVAVAGLVDFQAWSTPHCVRCAQKIGIETNAVADRACPGAAITKMNSDGVVSLRRQNPNRRPNGSFSEFQVNDISACQIEPLRGSRTNESSIIPYHGGKRFRQFLEP